MASNYWLNNTMIEEPQEGALGVLQSIGIIAEDHCDGRLNWGGCCWFAACVGRELERLGVPVEVCMAGPDDPELDDSCGHAWLKFQLDGTWYYYDAESLSMVDNKGRETCTATVEQAARMYARGFRHGMWNSMFRARKYIPAILKPLRKHLFPRLRAELKPSTQMEMELEQAAA